jgi:hypothetical protein
MIRCGWCGRPTAPAGRCQRCGHEDPGRPWVQRGQEPPDVADPSERLREARVQLEQEGRNVTTEALAEVLEVSPSTIKRWSKVAH